jgi:hypothetical protein
MFRRPRFPAPRAWPRVFGPVLVLALAGGAGAASGRDDAVPGYPYSLTFSPGHLLGLLSLEASLERMLTPHTSLAVIAGAGTIPSGFGWRRGPGLDLQEVGAQWRWYPRPASRWNTHLGLEGFWGRADFRQDMSTAEDEWSILDFSGVWTAWGVFEIQGGLQAFRVRDENGTVNTFPVPIFNLNIGQAF